MNGGTLAVTQPIWAPHVTEVCRRRPNVWQCLSNRPPDTSGYTISRGLPGVVTYLPNMNPASHILIVDDHREIRELVGRVLTQEGFRFSAAADGKAMRAVLTDSRIDLILLDLMLPGEDGLSLCRAIRANSNIPIVMLTAKSEEVDRVIGLEMGADDYLPKPFGSRELIARIRAVLRRGRLESVRAEAIAGPRQYQFDRWLLNAESRELVSDDGVMVPLSTGEYEPAAGHARASPARPEPRSTPGFDSWPRRGGIRPQHRHPGEPAAQKAGTRPRRTPADQDHLGRRLYVHADGRAAMSRLFAPRTLFGQMITILLTGLIISHLAGAWIYAADREKAVRAIGGYAATQRISNITRLVEDAPEDWRGRIATSRRATQRSAFH